ncbi:hypothetical protein AVEN_150987-1 [Araneus ventricosus]|uniref:Uncharacterized protein n=1 Tax=Araneus ventricosus TaxID=182803 RepID=A0A4Y2RJA9_ARAVE|nr:hypothetical protein AVEN_150987-1 [Araneus ventricosus]
MVAAYGEYIFVLPIMGYALLMELFNYAKSMMICNNQISDEKAEHNHLKQVSIPIVRKRSIWLFCKALSMEAELAVDLDAKNDNNVQTPVPKVRNPAVLSICKKLGIKAKMEFPRNYEMAKPNAIPTVFIKDVYLLCRALKIKAQMHP